MMSVAIEVIMNAKAVPLPAIGLLAASVIAPAAPPVVITVNSTADTTANDNACTLREAIISATTNTASSDTTNGCIAGAPSPAVDEIAFAIPGTDPGCSGGPPKI